MDVGPETTAALSARFGESSVSQFRGQLRVQIERDSVHVGLQWLKDEHGFDLLVDITCVDYLRFRGAKDRFGLVYLLSNTLSEDRLTVRVMLNEPKLSVPTVTNLWKGANWLEREVWDMFGVTFEGHPDLRRILLPREFTSHPLRKDYPLQGRGERHNFPVLTRREA